MLLTTLLIGLLIAAGAAGIVLWPLLSRSAPDVPVEDDRLTELISRKDGVLIAIKDLEFDHQVGKLSDEDYQRFNFRLRQQAIGYLQQIDKLAPQSAQLDDVLEAEIARLRKTHSQAPAVNGRAEPVIDRATVPAASPVTASPVTASPVTASPAAEPVAAMPTPAGQSASTSGRFCTNCGQALAPNHKFCAQCGTAAG